MQAHPEILDVNQLDALIAALRDRGYEVRGARECDEAIVLGEIARADDLPRGRLDETEAGSVKVTDAGRDAYFDHVLPMQGLKPHVFPARERLMSCDAEGAWSADPAPTGRYAMFGVRACDLAALNVLETVFTSGPYPDSRFAMRRDGLFIVAVNCARPAATCFCASMDTGPKAESGFDIVLTELLDGGPHRFLVEAGSPAGADLLSSMPTSDATASDLEAAARVTKDCIAGQSRVMPGDTAALLRNNLESSHWNDVADRCLSCGNCTLVCPTCFCNALEDASSLDGRTAERWRRWDSCFGIEYSYIHGGAVREQTSARYRQWITHKLSTWRDQFGESGCVGCGRCIAWCPVGIDITAEVAVLAAGAGDDGGNGAGRRAEGQP